MKRFVTLTLVFLLCLTAPALAQDVPESGCTLEPPAGWTVLDRSTPEGDPAFSVYGLLREDYLSYCAATYSYLTALSPDTMVEMTFSAWAAPEGMEDFADRTPEDLQQLGGGTVAQSMVDAQSEQSSIVYDSYEVLHHGDRPVLRLMAHAMDEDTSFVQYNAVVDGVVYDLTFFDYADAITEEELAAYDAVMASLTLPAKSPLLSATGAIGAGETASEGLPGWVIALLVFCGAMVLLLVVVIVVAIVSGRRQARANRALLEADKPTPLPPRGPQDAAPPPHPWQRSGYGRKD